MIRCLSLWIAGLLLLLAAPSSAAAQSGGIAPLASYTVETRLRTLYGLPLKRVITSPKGWKRVVADLRGAPPPPDFKQGHVSLLVVADVSGKARSWVESIRRVAKDRVRVTLGRVNGQMEIAPHLRAFFFHFASLEGGIELLHRTTFEQSTIQSKFAPDAHERDPRRLPQLGPDMRFSYSLPVGTPPLKGAVKLRHETYYSKRGLPGRLDTAAFPDAGLPFPRIRKGTGTRHIYAAHTERLRSKNALAIVEIPPKGRDGSPQVVRHTFALEPIPRRP